MALRLLNCLPTQLNSLSLRFRNNLQVLANRIYSTLANKSKHNPNQKLRNLEPVQIHLPIHCCKICQKHVFSQKVTLFKPNLKEYPHYCKELQDYSQKKNHHPTLSEKKQRRRHYATHDSTWLERFSTRIAIKS